MPAVVRPPAVAGRFYPADPAALGALVDRLLAAVPVPAGEPLAPAYVVPHAGYRYSGPTAAHVYARLAVRAGQVRRVVLVGPAHYVPVRGCVVPAAPAWRTPLGEVPVDDAGRAAVGLVADDEPFAPEHSLEVQLPFLQRVLPPGVPVLPVLAGVSTVDEVAAVLARLVEVGGAGTTIVCSTDLSHYLNQPAAQAQDARTAAAITDLAPERIGTRDACGVFALRGMLGWARRTGLRASVLHRCTSADTAGQPERVVGYCACAVEPGGPPATRRPAD
ncbi:MAG: AmmeMemoRadiSam system protein B [Micromonosporaceae bacterium]|nr:AmmeMemoRadiSam system protein B [Micromonosporaceae bacterium]